MWCLFNKYNQKIRWNEETLRFESRRAAAAFLSNLEAICDVDITQIYIEKVGV